MMETKIKKIVFTALMIALGVILPLGFHMVGAAGPIFLPMHFPVFIAGIILGPCYGMAVGMITPVISSLVTGMPPLLPMLPIMFIELALYGFVMGLFYQKKKIIFPGLIAAMITGRVGAGLVVWVLVHLFNVTQLPLSPFVFISGSVIKGLPGIAVQLILIPLVVKHLRKEIKDVQGFF